MVINGWKCVTKFWQSQSNYSNIESSHKPMCCIRFSSVITYVGQILEGPCEHVRGGGVQSTVQVQLPGWHCALLSVDFHSCTQSILLQQRWCVRHHVIGSTPFTFSADYWDQKFVSNMSCGVNLGQFWLKSWS